MRSATLTLRPPVESDKSAVMLFCENFIGHNEDGEIPGSGGLATAKSYEDWLNRIHDYAHQETVPQGLVQASTLLVYRNVDSKLVGVVQIRHQLNEHLLQVGGHIGYSVASDERRKGYATEILRLSLEYCRRLGMSRVLVTCDKSNVASARVIQANGGALEDEVTCDNVTKRRYWIQI